MLYLDVRPHHLKFKEWSEMIDQLGDHSMRLMRNLMIDMEYVHPPTRGFVDKKSSIVLNLHLQIAIIKYVQSNLLIFINNISETK